MAGFRQDLPPQQIGDTWLIPWPLTDTNGNPISLPDGPYTGTFVLETQPGGTVLLTCSTADTSPVTLVIAGTAGTITLTVVPTVTAALDGLTYPYPTYKLTVVDANGVTSTLYEGICPLHV